MLFLLHCVKKKLEYYSILMYNLNRNSGVSLRSTLGEVGCVRPPLSIRPSNYAIMR